MLVEKCGKSQARSPLGFISPPPVPGQDTQEGAQPTRGKKGQQEEEEQARLREPPLARQAEGREKAPGEGGGGEVAGRRLGASASSRLGSLCFLGNRIPLSIRAINMKPPGSGT